jgi:hypothetical protein
MTAYTTRTSELGEVTFTAPAATENRAGYVWIESEHGYPARDRRQICYGGDFRGNTVTATTGSLKADAQAWLRARRRYLRKNGLA